MDHVEELKAEIEQLRVQLAGCSVAALGCGDVTPCKQGDYGWSVAYEDVRRLRKETERLQQRVIDLTA